MYRRHYGKDGDVLIWQADTRSMNPIVPESIITAAHRIATQRRVGVGDSHSKFGGADR